MTEYLKKRFTVPYGGRSATDCEHGWLDPRGKCVMCGEKCVVLAVTTLTFPNSKFLASYDMSKTLPLRELLRPK